MHKGPVAASTGEAEASSFFGSLPTRLDSWITIDRAGQVTAYVGKVELGTGVETALAQIVAEELDVAVESVSVVQGQTGITPNQGFTAGSQTLQSGSPPLRKAAAYARLILLSAAGKRLNAPVGSLAAHDGIVSASGTDRTITYGELVNENLFDREIDQNVPLKKPSQFRYVGKAVGRVDIPAKVFGTFAYVQDMKMAGVWHGRVIRPAAVGAHLERVDRSSIADIPDIRIVQERDFLAVAGPDAWATIRAARALKTSWSGGALPAFDRLYTDMTTGPTTEDVIAKKGDVDRALAADAHLLNATYMWPFQSHGSIGPSSAVADVRPDRATIWAATQGVYALRGAIAKLLKLSEDAVRVVYVEAAGCYGHNGADDAAADAALVSQAIGKPVRVQWSLADELGWDPKGPAMVMELRGVLGAGGKVAGWSYEVWTPTHVNRAVGRPGNLLAAQLAGLQATEGWAGGGDRNARSNYTFANERVVVHWKPTSALRQSALRSLGGAQNTFANESFMDELAFAAGADPVAFRLAHLDDPRGRAVLEAVARRANWQSSKAARSATDGATVTGRGVAFARYDNESAYVAAVADCELVPSTGAVRVREIYIAHDCGQIINPDGLRNQIEGNAIQATSRSLKEEVRYDRERVTSIDWESYPILRFPEIPDVHIELIDRPDEPPLGAGEPTTIVMAPAIANAIFAAGGIRVRRVPFTPERVRAARNAS